MRRWREARAKRTMDRESDRPGDELTDQLFPAIEAVGDEAQRTFLTEALLAGDVKFRHSKEFEGAVVYVAGVPLLNWRLTERSARISRAADDLERERARGRSHFHIGYRSSLTQAGS